MGEDGTRAGDGVIAARRLRREWIELSVPLADLNADRLEELAARIRADDPLGSDATFSVREAMTGGQDLVAEIGMAGPDSVSSVDEATWEEPVKTAWRRARRNGATVCVTAGDRHELVRRLAIASGQPGFVTGGGSTVQMDGVAIEAVDCWYEHMVMIGDQVFLKHPLRDSLVRHLLPGDAVAKLIEQSDQASPVPFEPGVIEPDVAGHNGSVTLRDMLARCTDGRLYVASATVEDVMRTLTDRTGLAMQLVWTGGIHVISVPDWPDRMVCAAGEFYRVPQTTDVATVWVAEPVRRRRWLDQVDAVKARLDAPGAVRRQHHVPQEGDSDLLARSPGAEVLQWARRAGAPIRVHPDQVKDMVGRIMRLAGAPMADIDVAPGDTVHVFGVQVVGHSVIERDHFRIADMEFVLREQDRVAIAVPAHPWLAKPISAGREKDRGPAPAPDAPVEVSDPAESDQG